MEKNIGILTIGDRDGPKVTFLGRSRSRRKKTFCLRPKAEAEAEGLKISIFLPQKIKEHLFIMLLKLVISTLPYNTIDCSFEDNKKRQRQKELSLA